MRPENVENGRNARKHRTKFDFFQVGDTQRQFYGGVRGVVAATAAAVTLTIAAVTLTISVIVTLVSVISR